MTWDKEKQREYLKQYYLKNKEKIDRQHREYDGNHKEEKRKQGKKDYQKNKEYFKEYREKHREKQTQYCKEYYQKNKEKLKEYQKNKDNIKEYQRGYRQENKGYIKKYRQENKDKRNSYYYKRKKIDKNFKITCNLRNSLYKALKKYTKIGKIMSSKKYGINYKSIIEYLKPFPKDLSKYHVDHIKPLCSFNLENPEEIKKAFAPENHQWLLAQENMIKGGRYGTQ